MRIGAIVVDAGYLFSAGSDVAFGRVHRRQDLRLRNPAGLLEISHQFLKPAVMTKV